MIRRKNISALCSALLLTVLTIAARPCCAINIVVDYTYDTTNFFGAGNPSGATAGAQAHAAIEATALFYSGILTDTFSAISKPADFHSASFTGNAFWDWSLNFNNPSTGALVTLNNQTIPADVYRIYVGARSLAGSTLGIGGPGGVSYSSNNNGGGFTQAEINQITQITNTFFDSVSTRGEGTGFASWGGAITFDRDAATVWNYSHTTLPTAGTNDFFSVAIHEMGHSLGLGASDEWTNFATGSNFTGPASTAAHGSAPPLDNPPRAHWASGTMSKIIGTNTVQEAAMDPEILQGTRKLLTSLDAAALTDIGWSVVAPSFNSADFNQDGTVNGPDLPIWRSAFASTTGANADGDSDTDGNDFLLWQRRLGHVGAATPASFAVPEPGSVALTAWGVLLMIRHRRMTA